MENYKETQLIPFDMCDPAGILFYGNLFQISHRLLENFIVSKNIEWKEWFKSSEWIVPIKSVEAEYFAPIFAGKKHTCQIEVSRIGSSSITFKTTISTEKGKICAEATSAHVFVDPHSGKSMKIPEKFRAAFEENKEEI